MQYRDQGVGLAPCVAPQPVTETPAPPPSKPPAKLEDSDEDEPEEPKQVANALAEISLKPKAGRSGVRLQTVQRQVNSAYQVESE